jgi:hypothetical protein
VIANLYEVRSGRHAVAVEDASTPHEALVGYLRALGCPRDEMTRLGADAIAWRGAVYRAVPADRDELARRAA